MKFIYFTPLLFLSLSCSFTASEFACEKGDSEFGKVCVDGVWVTLASQDTSNKTDVTSTDMGTPDTTNISDVSPDLGPVEKCGNGILDQGEECDGAPTATCVDLQYGSGDLACGGDCKFDITGCIALPTCGNGTLDPDEKCEGENLDSQACSDVGFDGGTLACNDKCVFETAGCFVCGDGEKNGNEECDGNDFGAETCPEDGALTCTDTCTINKDTCFQCGNGVAEQTEVCDGEDLRMKTCADQDATLLGGKLGCNADCGSFNIAECKLQYTQVAAGSNHTCAIKSDKTVVCWGNNQGGKSTAPAGEFTEVRVGETHSCGIKVGGTIECWGSNTYTRGGVVSPSNQSVAPAGTFTSLATGDFHSCALDNAGTVTCWGLGVDGQLGLSNQSVFTSLGLALGRFHSCGVTAAGVECVGWDDNGQATPPAGFTKKVAGGQRHTCAIRQDDTLICWGFNMDGQATPPLGQFKDIRAGKSQNCAIDLNDNLECWGSINPPTLLPKFRSVSIGKSHVCGISIDGELICWGSNGMGQRNIPAL